MSKNLTKSAIGAGLAICAAIGVTGNASAKFTEPSFTGDNFQIWGVPNTTEQVEEQVFINGTMFVGPNEDLLGNIGNQNNPTYPENAYWVTTDADGIWAANGYATIKSGDTRLGDNTVPGVINDLTFGVKNSYFEDVEFSVEAKDKDVNVQYTLTLNYDNNTTENIVLDTKNSGLEDMLVLATNGRLFKSINLYTAAGLATVEGVTQVDGITQYKQWNVSGPTPVPLPAAAWLFGPQ